jgi:hypothetical protein
MDPAREPIVTPRLQFGIGLLAFGIGLMFFSGKVLPAPVAAGIVSGITLAVTGLVLVIAESLRDRPDVLGDTNESGSGGDPSAPKSR